MHQNMVEEFSVIPPTQKLLMLEEAVGFQGYRQRVLEAQERLTQVLSEESAVSGFLNNAEHTLHYWKEQHGKYLQKKDLIERKAFLERELAWAYVAKLEKTLSNLEQELEKRKHRLQQTLEEINITKDETEEAWKRVKAGKGIRVDFDNFVDEMKKW